MRRTRAIVPQLSVQFFVLLPLRVKVGLGDLRVVPPSHCEAAVALAPTRLQHRSVVFDNSFGFVPLQRLWIVFRVLAVPMGLSSALLASFTCDVVRTLIWVDETMLLPGSIASLGEGAGLRVVRRTSFCCMPFLLALRAFRRHD